MIREIVSRFLLETILVRVSVYPLYPVRPRTGRSFFMGMGDLGAAEARVGPDASRPNKLKFGVVRAAKWGLLLTFMTL